MTYSSHLEQGYKMCPNGYRSQVKQVHRVEVVHFELIY